MCIDVFSRFMFVRPLLDKTNKHVRQAFESIFVDSGRQPKKIRTDQGSEFVGKVTEAYLKRQRGIEHFVTYSDKKVTS